MKDDGEDRPILGDVWHDYPVGTPLSKILEFEIWNGVRWVKNTEADKQEYQVQAQR